jgi:long-subunit fatty acid transport protein
MSQIKIYISITAILLSSFSWSQTKIEKTAHPFWKNVRFGGGMQLSIGNGYTAIGISPSAIYEVSDQFAFGVGASYLYSGIKLQDIHYHVFGISSLILYNPIKEIQLSTEFEELRINRISNKVKSAYWYPALYIGAAYSMGRHTAIGVRYDVLYDADKSIYDSAYNPFIRVYF